MTDDNDGERDREEVSSERTASQDARGHYGPGKEETPAENPRDDPDDSATTEPESGPGLSRTEWKELASNPDLREDLGYRISDWERFQTLDGSDQIMLMPEDESLLKEDAFIVARDDMMYDLGDHC